jgi:hypothetical protein
MSKEEIVLNPYLTRPELQFLHPRLQETIWQIIYGKSSSRKGGFIRYLSQHTRQFSLRNCVGRSGVKKKTFVTNIEREVK